MLAAGPALCTISWKRWSATALAGLVLLSAPLSIAAQAQRTVDLSIVASASPGPITPPGTGGQITIAVRNGGPDAAANSIAIGSSLIFGPGEQLAIFAIPATAPCILWFEGATPVPGQPGSVLPILEFGQIAQNAARTCTIGFQVLAGAQGTLPLSFEVRDFSVNSTESNPLDNRIVLGLMFEALRVPALGLLGSIVLLAALMVAGQRTLRRGDVH